MPLLRLSMIMVVSTCALFAQVEPGAGAWRTWVVPTASDLRLTPPPSGADLATELQTVKSMLAAADDGDKAAIAYWNAGSPGYRWTQLGSQQMLAQNVAAPLFARAMALIEVAVYDATVAAWDSKYAYNRNHPSQDDSTITPLIGLPNSPSYPSEHAAAAGAASVVLGYLFPDQAANYAAMAVEAGQSRIYAGAAYPSDVDTGLALGQAVGQMVVAYAQQDGSDQVFTGSFPPAPGIWSSATPVTPLAGTWKPWTLPSGSAFRLPPPPAAGSDDASAQYAIVKNFTRTNASNHSAWFWQPSFITPWLDQVNAKVFENHLDQNPPRAARAYALETIAQYDATIACWDTKFAYLEQRPSQADPTITPVFGNPQHPGFPSGHACASGASSMVMGYLFPSDATALAAMAADAGASTFYAAIHTMFDVQQGLTLGTQVGQGVVDWAQNDGAQQTNVRNSPGPAPGR